MVAVGLGVQVGLGVFVGLDVFVIVTVGVGDSACRIFPSVKPQPVINTASSNVYKKAFSFMEWILGDNSRSCAVWKSKCQIAMSERLFSAFARKRLSRTSRP